MYSDLGSNQLRELLQLIDEFNEDLQYLASTKRRLCALAGGRAVFGRVCFIVFRRNKIVWFLLFRGCCFLVCVCV